MSLPALPNTGRPTPIRDAFKTVQGATAFLASVVAILAGWGVVSGVQGDAITGLLGAIPGVLSLIGDVVKSFQVKQAVADTESVVTPLASPAAVVEGRLVPLVPDPYARPGVHRA